MSLTQNKLGHALRVTDYKEFDEGTECGKDSARKEVGFRVGTPRKKIIPTCEVNFPGFVRSIISPFPKVE